MKQYEVTSAGKFQLKTYDPDETGEHKKTDEGKDKAKVDTAKLIARLTGLPERLYANVTRSLLIVLQGKVWIQAAKTNWRTTFSGGSIVKSRRTGTSVSSTDPITKKDVLITRVHGWVSDAIVKRRSNQIKEFEELLHKNGTVILKFFLHISKSEWKERLEARIADPEKRWKWNSGDVEERKLWGGYRQAFEDVLSATSTKQAPWYIVPAKRKRYRNLVAAERVVEALEGLKLETPPGSEGVDFSKLKIV